MKPFDLEAAKRGEPFFTRNGLDGKLIAHVPDAKPDSRVVVLIMNAIHVFYENGELYQTIDSCHDLFMKPKKKTVWVNFYNDYHAVYYDTKKEADKYASSRRIGGHAYQIEIEE